MNNASPTLKDIRAAGGRIRGAVMDSPCLLSETLSGIVGCTIYLKFENLQFTASFKERGALNKLLTLSADQRAAGVCAVSAGNHAQGVAYHARRLGIPTTIVMPRGTPFTKIARTRDHGAEVIVAGTNLSDAMKIAESLTAERSLVSIHPYDDADVIAGQGTLGLEILSAIDGLDAIVVPIGGGGLISGIATAVRAIDPQVKIIGVETSTYPSMTNALAGKVTPCPDGMTIAEGIAVKVAGRLTRQIVRELVDEIILVEEASIEQAVALLQSVEKTVVEGAGAAGLAGIMQHREMFQGKRVATLLTGGNIDSRMFASVIMRALVRSGQLLRFDVPISDQPGALAVLSTILGDAGANVVDVSHDRMSLALNPKGAVLDVVVEVQDRTHGQAVLDSLKAQNFEPVVKSVG